MALFYYKAVNEDGDVLEGNMEAITRDDVVVKLQNAGNTPLHVQPSKKEKGKWSGTIELFNTKNKVTKKDVALLTRELATITSAGLALDHALDTLVELTANPAVKKLLANVSHRIKSGEALSTALESHPTIFSSLYINTVRAGEASGALDVVLNRLADHVERAQEMRSLIVSALIYPALLFVVATISVLLLLSVVVPQFVPLFEDVGQALPLLTQIVFGASQLLSDYWWLLLVTVIALAWGMDRQLKQPQYRYRWDAFVLRAPLVGGILTKLEVARFASTLATLLQNGVPLIKSMEIVEAGMQNSVFRELINQSTDALEHGGKLAFSLSKSTCFPSLALQLIKVGENSGQLEAMLEKTADIYEKETNNEIKRMLVLLEPVLILGLGAIIAVIIISILIAILGLNDLVI